jgi:hypothetical protein
MLPIAGADVWPIAAPSGLMTAMRCRTTILLFFLVIVTTPVRGQDADGAPALPDDLQLEVLPLPEAAREALEARGTAKHVLSDPEWHTWGASVVRGEDGRWHLFHSRWPRATAFTGWLPLSQIAHAVADDPAGPYEHLGVALAGRGPGHWDAVSAHNPVIARFDGHCYLYYISTRIADEGADLAAIASTGYAHGSWKELREAQRTGVAVADSPDGPWRRLDAPILEPSGPIETLTVNPAVARAPDGTVLLIVKGDRPGTPGFVRSQALALAPTPTGPFEIQPEPVIDDRDTEDAALWYDPRRRRFYAVFHAHDHIGLITSADGRRWEGATHPVVLRKGAAVAFDDGTRWPVDRLERPFVLLDGEGVPSHLFVAVKRGDESANLALPLRR